MSATKLSAYVISYILRAMTAQVYYRCNQSFLELNILDIKASSAIDPLLVGDIR